MAEWLREWGNKPRRKVRPFWSSPGLVLRQATSALCIGALTHWAAMPLWLARYGPRCLRGAAGSRGMGCIGFPSHPVWEMTAACNLNCVHCHVPSTEMGEELDTVEGKALLEQLAEVREFQMMAFTGGEPLMRDDLYELLAYSRALGFVNTIATNATLVDDQAARRLRAQGVVIAAVSLDGAQETHDLVRGCPGAFESAIKGMKALRRAGILLHINITAMEQNLGQVQSVMDAVEKLGASIILMYQLVPVGRGKSIERSALDKADNEHLIRFMVEAQARSRGILEPVAGPQYWAYLLKSAGIEGGPFLSLARKVFHGCSAGRGFVYVKPDGEVLPCPFMPVSCGNIRQTAFSSIWSDSPIFHDLRLREERLKGDCGECRYNSLCGGCRGRSLAVEGDYLAHDPSCFMSPPVAGGKTP